MFYNNYRQGLQQGKVVKSVKTYKGSGLPNDGNSNEVQDIFLKGMLDTYNHTMLARDNAVPPQAQDVIQGRVGFHRLPLTNPRNNGWSLDVIGESVSSLAAKLGLDYAPLNVTELIEKISSETKLGDDLQQMLSRASLVFTEKADTLQLYVDDLSIWANLLLKDIEELGNYGIKVSDPNETHYQGHPYWYIDTMDPDLPYDWATIVSKTVNVLATAQVCPVKVKTTGETVMAKYHYEDYRTPPPYPPAEGFFITVGDKDVWDDFAAFPGNSPYRNDLTGIQVYYDEEDEDTITGITIWSPHEFLNVMDNMLTQLSSASITATLLKAKDYTFNSVQDVKDYLVIAYGSNEEAVMNRFGDLILDFGNKLAAIENAAAQAVSQAEETVDEAADVSESKLQAWRSSLASWLKKLSSSLSSVFLNDDDSTLQSAAPNLDEDVWNMSTSMWPVISSAIQTVGTVVGAFFGPIGLAIGGAVSLIAKGIDWYLNTPNSYDAKISKQSHNGRFEIPLCQERYELFMNYSSYTHNTTIDRFSSLCTIDGCWVEDHVFYSEVYTVDETTNELVRTDYLNLNWDLKPTRTWANLKGFILHAMGVSGYEWSTKMYGELQSNEDKDLESVVTTSIFAQVERKNIIDDDGNVMSQLELRRRAAYSYAVYLALHPAYVKFIDSTDRVTHQYVYTPQDFYIEAGGGQDSGYISALEQKEAVGGHVLTLDNSHAHDDYCAMVAFIAYNFDAYEESILDDDGWAHFKDFFEVVQKSYNQASRCTEMTTSVIDAFGNILTYVVRLDSDLIIMHHRNFPLEETEMYAFERYKEMSAVLGDPDAFGMVYTKQHRNNQFADGYSSTAIERGQVKAPSISKGTYWALVITGVAAAVAVVVASIVIKTKIKKFKRDFVAKREARYYKDQENYQDAYALYKQDPSAENKAALAAASTAYSKSTKKYNKAVKWFGYVGEIGFNLSDEDSSGGADSEEITGSDAVTLTDIRRLIVPSDF